ncbi:hypothetical protein Bhyg_10631, partial [Pseudolycoriella hygida]
MSVSKCIRPLGSIETFVDGCTVSRNLNMAIAVTVKTKTKITLDVLEQALINLQAGHLQLQACLERREEIPEKSWSLNPFKWFASPKPVTKPEFWSLPDAMTKIPIKVVISKNFDWMSVLEDCLQLNFQEGNLLWRAYWVESNNDNDNRGALVLNFHPFLSDSKGLFLLANDALGHLDEILTGKSHRTVTPKMHSNVEETVDIGNGLSFVEKVLMFKHMIMFSIPWKSPYMSRHAAPVVPDYTTRHIQIDVPIEFSKKILKCVENKSVSLHAAWTAAASIAMHEMLTLKTATKFRSTHEVDLRVLTKNYNATDCRIYGAYCNYVEDTVETDRVNSAEEFWNFAATCHKGLFDKLRSDELVKMMKYCAEFGDMYPMVATLGSVRCVRNDFAIAVHDNIDLFVDDREAIQIENLCSSVASQNMGSPFHHTVHVFREQIYYYIHVYSNYTTIDKTKEFAYKTLEVLKKHCV